MVPLISTLFATFILIAQGQAISPGGVRVADTRPAVIGTADLVEFESLAAPRRRLIEAALAVARDSPWLPYLAGSADPGEGGFDCSGAMFFVMRKVQLDPPRSSRAQFAWLKENGNLHEVPPEATDTRHPSLADLRPGDLLFWTVTVTPLAGPSGPVVHHVAMYLGTEKKDGRPVMINSTDGRTYRGRKANGYGVYDFRVPKPESTSKLAGYGTPPGISEK